MRRLEGALVALVAACGALAVLSALVVIAFVARVGVRGLLAVGPMELLGGVRWKPEAGVFGGAPLVVGTAASSLGAVLCGAVPAVVAALWAHEIAGPRVRASYRRLMEVAAAVPSVVYGWLAISALVPGVEVLGRALLGAEADVAGEGLAATSLLLGVMIAPTVFVLSYEALARVPAPLRDASLALGASRWQTAVGLALPAARRGVLVAVFFGLARAAGETMAVQMVVGGARALPRSPFEPTTTIAAQIVMDMQNAQPGTTASDVLFSMALVLLVFSVAVVLGVRLLVRADGR